MTSSVFLFWLCFLLPGYALARRWNLSLLQSGLPGAVAMSAFASLAAVCVFIVPAHVLGLPTLALSAGLVAFVLWGVVDLTRSRQWSGLARLMIAAAGAELVVLGIDLLTSARVGTVLGADAVVHVARIRHLLGQGLTNGDPFLGGHFYPIYHTNLLHSLLASVSQITGEDPLKVWFSSLPFAKVLIFCGAWFAGWSIFRNSISGWATAMFVLGSRGPVTFVLYPNQLAPWFLIPMLVGLCVLVIRGDRSRQTLLLLALGSMVLGSTHGMYSIFLAMAVMPPVGAILLWRWRQQELPFVSAVLSVAALGAGLPFPAVTFLTKRAATVPLQVAAKSTVAESRPKSPALPKVSNRFKQLDNGWVMHRFGRGFTGNRYLRLYVLAMAVALALMIQKEREACLILGSAVSVAAWLHVPPLCTLLLKAGGAEWMVLRLGSIMDVLFALFVPGAVAAVVAKVLAQNSAPRVFPTLVFRWSFGMCCLFLGAFFASHNGPYTWKSYLQRGEYDKGVRYGTQLNPLRRLSDDLEAVVPEDAVVLADPSIGMKVVMAHDCRVVTSTSSSVGVRGMGGRNSAVREMLAGKTEEERRSSLLDQYDVTYLVAQRPAPNWTFERMASFYTTEFGWCIIGLRSLDEPKRRVEGEYEQALLDAGRDAEAIVLLEKKVEGDPENFKLVFRLGRALYKRGRQLEAVDVFYECLNLRPDDARPAIMIGNAYSDLEWYEDAITAYRMTMDIAAANDEPNAGASAAFNLGNMYFRLEMWAEAVEAYAEALLLDSNHADAQYWSEQSELRLAEEQAFLLPKEGSE